jgi:phage-related protein
MVEAVLAYTLKCVDETSSTMEKVRASIGLLGSAVGELGGGFTSLGNVMTGLASAGVAGAVSAGIGEVIKGLQWSVEEAAASEQAMRNLAAAVERSGIAWQSVQAPTQEFLSQMQRVTVYSDEALAGLVERLLTFGMTYEQAMQASATAVDLAAAKHMDLQSAADLVGKAFIGNTGALQRYGVDMDALKKSLGEGVTDAQVYEAALAKLNEQFGGAAAEQAKTYAGTQERLKNAVSDLGEKVGGILLPALTQLTEGMIPVADAFGRGVDAVQAWLTEVGKMPEVKAFVDETGKAFEGFKGYLESVWNVIVDSFKPALEALWDAFKELWNALQPAIDAFKEIFGALSAGGEDVDAFKLLIQYLAAEIRVIADVIKFVAPYIKMLADTFKAAADFISPVLAQMSKDVGAFIDWLKGALSDFYTWLVGGSLWMDMWNELRSIASQMIGTLLGDLGAKLFEPIKAAFTSAMEAVEDLWDKGWNTIQTTGQTIWNTIKTNADTWITAVKTTVSNTLDSIKTTWDTSWQAVKTTLDNLMPQIQTNLNTALDGLKNSLSTSLGTYGPTMTSALDGVKSAVNAGFALIKEDWSGALGNMKDALGSWGSAANEALNGIMGGLKTALDEGIGGMKSAWNSFLGGLSGAVGEVQQAFGGVQQAVTGAAEGAQAPTENAMTAVTNAFDSAFTTISNAASGFWNWLTGQSLWPDMLDLMQEYTSEKLTNVMLTWQEVQTAIQESTVAWFSTMIETYSAYLNGISSMFSATFAAMVASAQAAMSQIVSIVYSAMAMVQGAATQTHKELVGGSVWTDMLDEMRAQTDQTMRDIVRTFQSGYGGIEANVPFVSPTRGIEPATVSAPDVRTEVTVPIRVDVDGYTIASVVERRMIQQMRLGRYST